MKSSIGRKGTVLLAVVALAAAAVAGGALAAIAAHSTGAMTTTVKATESNYEIVLSKKIVVPGNVHFVVHNSSKTAHKFGVKGNGVSKSISGLIQPGQTKSLTVLLKKKGTYTVYCALHASRGMKTTLTVGPGSGPPPTTTAGTSG
jgi:plastocyanin